MKFISSDEILKNIISLGRGALDGGSLRAGAGSVVEDIKLIRLII